MITTKTMNNSPIRRIKARVDCYNGATLVSTYSYTDALISIDVERVGEGKFFGFGICQKLNLHLRDPQRAINISTANSFNIFFDDGSGYICPLPKFYVTEVNRDENTNELSITAYDLLHKATAHTVGELQLTSYTILQFAQAAAALLGASGVDISVISDPASFAMEYPNGANFEGTETIRSALNAVAEATQTIYYIDDGNTLVFKRLDRDGTEALRIDRENYFTLDSKTNRRLSDITSATELGDNVTASTGVSGSMQYVRDNPFWDMQENVAELVEGAIVAVGGLTINQFDLAWRGNYLLEIGDKIAIETKDGGSTISYVLNDVLSYNGAFTQRTQWEYSEEEETASNPSNLGDALKQTFAKVDKANKTIELVASDVGGFDSRISTLELNTDSITASVSNVEKATNERLDDINTDIATLTQRVSATMDEESIKLEIEKAMQDGTNQVTTNTGFTFNDEGLEISKSGSEITTTITEDGMKVYKNSETVLTADNEGVKAIDLHATTFLIIGSNSRFEDYQSNRTGCFWIGGS